MRVLKTTVHLQRRDEFMEFVGTGEVYPKGTPETQIDPHDIGNIGDHCWEELPDEEVAVKKPDLEPSEEDYVRGLALTEIREYATETLGIDASKMSKKKILEALGYGTVG